MQLSAVNNNLIIYVSSRNNYDMLRGEVLKNIDTNGFEFINVDDNSSKKEKRKGRKICEEHNIVFLSNERRGVQFATQTIVNFINQNRPFCKYIICFQHDNFPISPNFFNRISILEKQGKLGNFGAIGFNVLDDGRYTEDSLSRFEKNENPLGIIGLCHLTVKNVDQRWICPSRNEIVKKHPEFWQLPFVIEMPMWAAVGINIEAWNKFCNPTDEYHFHLWFPDVMMQFNKNNYPCLILPNLYCVNRQRLKKKYGIPVNSAQAAKKGDNYHFGEYGSHFKVFKKRWGWDYEDVTTFSKVSDRYKETLLYQYFMHDLSKGPLYSIDLGEY